MWICINMQRIRLFHWLKNPAIWLRTFRSISQEADFSQIWDLCRNAANNINFHYRTNSVTINDKISQYIKKIPVFGPFLAHFPNFLSKKKIFWKIRLPRTTSYGFLASCQNLEKTNDTIPRKRLDRWKDWRTEGWTEGRTGPIL